MGTQAHELSIFPGSWKGSTFHCSPLVIRWLLAYWATGILIICITSYNSVELPWNQVKKSLFIWKPLVTYCFPELAYFMGWMLTILIINLRGGNINLHFVSHLHVTLQMHKHTLNASEWESDSSQWIRHFSFYMMCWGICFSNATSRLQISRNWLLLDHFPLNPGSPSETKTHQPIP